MALLLAQDCCLFVVHEHVVHYLLWSVRQIKACVFKLLPTMFARNINMTAMLQRSPFADDLSRQRVNINCVGPAQ